jgi:glycosyltransferase involved in cell wall biosynthesis
MTDTPDLSLIVPCFDEAASIDSFLRRVEPVLEGLGKPFEILCVDDGSTDSTLEKLLEHRSRNPAIKVIRLSRNFGKEVALTAGLDYARGRAVIPIDCDLQDPPELTPDLVEKWGEGYDVVYATWEPRPSDDFTKRLTGQHLKRLPSLGW